MNARDTATWAALRSRLAAVEAYIPEAPAWRAATTDELDRSARAGPVWRAPQARPGRRSRLILALAVLGLLALLAAALYIGTPRMLELSAGPFGPYGHLRVTGTSASATLLPDGRVLNIAGEWQGPEGRADGQTLLWDSGSGWAPAPPPLEDRVAPTVTLLLDGRVLVSGGFGGPYAYASTAIASAEVFDPETGAFHGVGSMADRRVGHLATVLQDGRVLIVGGTGPGGAVTAAEIYDPRSESFSPAGIMAHDGPATASALLDDGTVLIGPIGQLWRPEYNNFTSAIVTMDGADFLTLTRLQDGTVLRVQGTPAEANIDIYFASVIGRPNEALENLNTVRTRFAATPLADGRVLITGGVAKTGETLSSVEAWDPLTGAFVELAPLDRAVADHIGILLPDGRVLIVFDAASLEQSADPFLYEPEALP